MSYFPFYTNITDKTFLIVGGGRVAQEKVNRLLRFTDSIVVVAPETELTEGAVTPGTKLTDVVAARETEMKESTAGPGTETNKNSCHKGLRVLRREYREEDLAMGDYVVAATGIRELDRKIAMDCRERGIPVNVVDDPQYCDFIFPSIVRKGDLTIAISTSGTSPAYAMQLRQEIEEILPPDIEGILARMGAVRSCVAAQVPEQKSRAAVYKKLLSALIGSGNAISDEEIAAIIEEHRGIQG